MISRTASEHVFYLVVLTGTVYNIVSAWWTWFYVIGLAVGTYTCLEFTWRKWAVREEPKRKAVLITGCDTGFGYDLVKALDDLGCTVFAGCLHASANGAKDLMTSCSKRVHVIQMDVSSERDVTTALSYISKRCSGRGLWAIVNNAGFNVMGDVEFLGPDLYHKAMNVNFYGAVRVTRSFLYLVRKCKGRVINISSGRGRFSWPRDSAYHVTKHCLETYSDSLRLEMRKFGVKVSVIEPGHFGAITACQDSVQFARYEGERDQMWINATPEMRETYGEYYLQSLLDGQSAGLRSSANTTKPVIDAMLDAMFNLKPEIRYMVDGSNGWFDKSLTFVRFRPYLPACLSDSILVWWSGCDKFPQKST